MSESLRVHESKARFTGVDPETFWWWMQSKALEEIAKEVQQDNFCIIDNFLGSAAMRSLRDECAQLHADGKLQPAKVADGRLEHSFSSGADRGDLMGWFDGEEAASWPKKTLAAYQQKLDTLIAELAKRNAHFKSISYHSKAQIACYPGGGAQYVRHCDNSCDSGHGEVRWPLVSSVLIPSIRCHSCW